MLTEKMSKMHKICFNSARTDSFRRATFTFQNRSRLVFDASDIKPLEFSYMVTIIVFVVNFSFSVSIVGPSENSKAIPNLGGGQRPTKIERKFIFRLVYEKKTFTFWR